MRHARCHSYTVRPNALTSAKTYRIEAGGLVIADEAGASRIIPWPEITAVDLVHAATRYAGNRSLCRLQLRSGAREEIGSCSYEGFARFRDQAVAFNAFARQLHEVLAAQGGAICFGREESPWVQRGRQAFAAGLVVLVIVLAVVLAQQGMPRWMTGMKLLLLVALLPALLRWVKRSRGGRYDPHALPAGRLPSEAETAAPGGGP